MGVKLLRPSPLLCEGKYGDPAFWSMAPLVVKTRVAVRTCDTMQRSHGILEMNMTLLEAQTFSFFDV